MKTRRASPTAFSFSKTSHTTFLSAFLYLRHQRLNEISKESPSKWKSSAARIITLEGQYRRQGNWSRRPPENSRPSSSNRYLRGDGLFKAKGRIWIWMTDDARQMPVKMEAKIPVGAIRADLISYEPK